MLREDRVKWLFSCIIFISILSCEQNKVNSNKKHFFKSCKEIVGDSIYNSTYKCANDSLTKWLSTKIIFDESVNSLATSTNFLHKTVQ
jgi:hypothetical protein